MTEHSATLAGATSMARASHATSRRQPGTSELHPGPSPLLSACPPAHSAWCSTSLLRYCNPSLAVPCDLVNDGLCSTLRVTVGTMASALGIGTGSEWHMTATSVLCSWYQRSAEQGHVLSMFNLGTCYRTGEGVGKDLTIAYKCAAQCIRFDRSLECHMAP